jgi:hypothetical protein
LKPDFKRKTNFTNGIEANSDIGVQEIRGTHPEWGTWRARLEKKDVPNSYGRDNFYLHNSQKNYTSGCIETCDRLKKYLQNYKDRGNCSIDVRVSYTDPTTGVAN